MIKWLKSLFGFDTPDTPVIAQEPVARVEEPKVETKVEKVEPKAQPVQAEPKKTTKKAAPAKAGTKRGPKKTGVTKTDLNKMTKDELEAFAKKTYKVDLDKRKKKADLVDQVLALSK
jgi:hypothetical protein